MGRRKYTLELLGPVVAVADSYADVLRRLSLPQAGGTQALVAKRIKEMGLDTSHFTRGRGRPAHNMLTPAEVLVPIDVGSPRRKPRQLKRSLLAIGRAPTATVRRRTLQAGARGGERDQKPPTASM